MGVGRWGSSTKCKGDRGEDWGCAYLRYLGYVVLERNYRWKRLEADLFVCKDRVLYLVEVKTRWRVLDKGIPDRKQSFHHHRLLNVYASRKRWIGECAIMRVDVGVNTPFIIFQHGVY